MSLKTTAAPLALLLAACAATPAFAQDTGAIQLEEITVYGARTAVTVPQTAQAEAEIQRTAGGVDVIPDTAFKSGPAAAVKDVLAYVPGVVTQPRFGPDARMSIRGSGLSRAYGNRGINAYIDGAPINTSDGLLDLSEVDPTAYRYVEVFKGANALRYGGNALGGRSTSSRPPAGTPRPSTAGSTSAASASCGGRSALAGSVAARMGSSHFLPRPRTAIATIASRTSTG
ncbi:Plug domain-containing protein [Brevundimonas naejangsanensis]|uniref:Plug domain-containing protein n=1 Tax=Brevundimonas naejangsanensis TaxID=588932 RepID=UPI0032099F59